MPLRAAENPPAGPLGLVLSDPNKHLSVTAALVVSALPLLCIAIFALIRIWVVVPVYSWLYILNVLSFVAPFVLYYAFLRNSTGYMLSFGVLSLALFILYVVYLIRVCSFVIACYHFSQDCKIDGSRVVGAVQTPRYKCSDYSVADFVNFGYWASTRSATCWGYGLLFGMVTVLSLVMAVYGFIYAVKLRKGILVTREAPVTYAYTINADGVTMTRGTPADGERVAVGIPV
ncbi:hypothetical protein FOZ62_026270, partial [Perkinsus olseni]